MPKLKDRFMLVMAASFVAAVLGMVTLHFLNFVFPGRYINMPLIGLEVFLDVYPLSTLKVALGIVSTFGISGLYAGIYVLILDYTGWRYLYAKALGMIIGGWFLFGHGTMRLLNIGNDYRDEPVSIAVFFVAHIFYGTYLFLAFKYLGAPEPEHIKSVAAPKAGFIAAPARKALKGPYKFRLKKSRR